MILMNMTRLLVVALTVIFGTILPGGAEEGRAVRGVVSVVAGNTVTVATDSLEEMAYGVNETTGVVKLDGKSGNLQDVAPGVVVEITPGANPNVAARIRIVPPKESEKQ